MKYRMTCENRHKWIADVTEEFVISPDKCPVCGGMGEDVLLFIPGRLEPIDCIGVPLSHTIIEGRN